MAGVSISLKSVSDAVRAAPYTLDTKVFSFRCACGNTPQEAQGTIARGLEMSPRMADMIGVERRGLRRC